MTPFVYLRPASVEAALAMRAADPASAFLAGGTTLVDLMKEGVAAPSVIIDINRLPGLGSVAVMQDHAQIGALVRNAAVATRDELRRRAPMLTQAVAAGASTQLRNMATVGGNLLQRTRCAYFRNPGFACNKRTRGAGCDAIDGHDRSHAVLGTAPSCIATHASDMAVALLALGGTVRTLAVTGEREIDLRDFFVEPGDTPWRETVLPDDAIITRVDVALPDASRRSVYLKVRDRASYEFALASAAVGLSQDRARILDARIALGGVATRPWRCEAAERMLVGRDANLATFAAAADAALAGSRPGRENGFKIELARRVLVRALTQASELPA